MTREALGGRDIAVGLNPHRSRNAPSTVSYCFLNFAEHIRAVFLDPAVVGYSGGGEDKSWKFRYSVEG